MPQRLNDTLGDAALIDESARTRHVIKQYVRFIAAHPAFIRMMYDEGKRSDPPPLLLRGSLVLRGRLNELPGGDASAAWAARVRDGPAPAW